MSAGVKGLSEEWKLARFLGLAALAMAICVAATVYMFGLAHSAWCRDQYRVATTHADTVTAARVCGAP